MHRSWNREAALEALFALILAGFFSYALIQSRQWSAKAALFPMLVSVPGALLALVLGLMTLYRAGRGERPAARPSRSSADLTMDEELRSSPALRRTARTFAWILGLLLAIWLLGQKLALCLFVLAYLKAAGEKWILSIVLTLTTAAFLVGIFEQVIHTAWHEGVLFEWLAGPPV